MPKNLFCESLFTIECILGKKIIARTLANICATGYGSLMKNLRKLFAKILKLNYNALSNQKKYKSLMV